MDIVAQTPEQAVQFVWWVSLALGAVVTGVVALLLWLIQRGAATIEGRVARIWDAGQRVANNTAHIPTLYRTREVASQILSSVLRIDAGAAAIEAHAKGCPGCPQCMLER